MRVLERARMVTQRVAIRSEQCAADVEKIEKDSGLFIDTFNQQEVLFSTLREFTRKGRTGTVRQLENVAHALKETPV